jgi:transposase, IS5 family
MHKARERLVRLAKTHGIDLRQSYARVGKFALIKQNRYAHAKQFKRAKKAQKTLKTYLGRVIRDIVRKIKGNQQLEEAFAHELMLARRVHAQNKNLRRVRRAPAGVDLRVFGLHAGGRVHRQGKAPQALRVRGQGERGNDAQTFEGRPVHRPCEGAAGQAL